MALPDEHFLQLVAVLRRLGHRDVGLLLVLEELPAAIVGVHRDQHAAFGVGHPVGAGLAAEAAEYLRVEDRKSTRLNSSHSQISYAVFCLKKKKLTQSHRRPSIHLLLD